MYTTSPTEANDLDSEAAERLRTLSELADQATAQIKPGTKPLIDVDGFYQQRPAKGIPSLDHCLAHRIIPAPAPQVPSDQPADQVEQGAHGGDEEADG